MNCPNPNCRQPIPDGAVFCPNCGTKPSPPVRVESGAATISGQQTVAPLRDHQAPALDAGSTFAERFAIVQKIGEGDDGLVYQATDTTTGQDVALKIFRLELASTDDSMRRLMAEASAARQIQHPNVVAVFDVAQWEGQPYMTMELVTGGNLRAWLVESVRGGAETPLASAAANIKGILSGLAEGHRRGLVHGDLKPENVLFAGDRGAAEPAIKLLDFGVATGARVSARAGSARLYAAPEQATSDAIGPSADLYAVTVIFYELLMEALPQARFEPVGKSRRDVPASIDAFIEKGLSARPRSRFQSVAEYRDALDRALAVAPPTPKPVVVPDPPTPLPPPPPQPPPPQPPAGPWASLPAKTRRWITIGGALIGLVVTYQFLGEDTGPASLPPVVDADRDGFNDTMDACPTVAGVAPNGCPQAAPPPPPPVDSDGDGVADSNDGCPQVPGPAPRGCPPAQTTASGVWRDDFNNRYQARHDGVNFEATTRVDGVPMRIVGTLNNAAAVFSVYATNTGALIFTGQGQVVRDAEGHTDINYSVVNAMGIVTPGRWHVNH
jgi:serine/threonine protein kinase